MKLILTILIFICILFIALLLDVFVDISPEIKLQRKFEPTVTYQDFAATLLTAISVLITFFGIGIAILAVFGYRHIVDTAVKTAVSAAVERAEANTAGLKVMQASSTSKAKSSTRKTKSSASEAKSPAPKKTNNRKR